MEETSLAPLVDRYPVPNQLPDTSWILRLKLRRPRRNLRCLSARQRRFKRALDLLGAVVLGLLALPIVAVAALAVKLTSRGPMIYSQVRVGLNLRESFLDRRWSNVGPPAGQEDRRSGRDRRKRPAPGRAFRLYKLRTMGLDAEVCGAQLATKGDPRVTCVGRLLRRTRIDELPQIWNVIKGDMSLVGPRPERPEFIDDLSQRVPGYLGRLGMKPGITGLAQVLSGYDTDDDSIRRKVSLDLLYLQNYCVKNDVKILLRTVGVVVTGHGAQ